MTLYEINQAIEDLVAIAVDEETGEINEEAYSQLDALQLARDEKIEQIALAIKNTKAEAEAVKAEKMALDWRQKNLVKKAERTSAYLQAMLGGDKFSTSKVAISYRDSVSVNIDPLVDFSKVPEEFIKYTPEISKKEITPYLKAGNMVEGITLEKKHNMIIK